LRQRLIEIVPLDAHLRSLTNVVPGRAHPLLTLVPFNPS
jgi:hypothetical protein